MRAFRYYTYEEPAARRYIEVTHVNTRRIFKPAAHDFSATTSRAGSALLPVYQDFTALPTTA